MEQAVARDLENRPLAGVEVLEVSSRPAGGYCGRLLHLMGAVVTRLALPTAADCPPEMIRALEESLHAGKSLIDSDDRRSIDDALARCSVIVVDSLHDDAFDGAITAVARSVVDARRPNCPVVDLSDHRPDRGSGGGVVPATAITATALAAMSWGLGSPDREPLTLPYDLPDYLSGTEAAGAAALALLRTAADPGACEWWDVATTDVLAYYVGQVGANFLPYERPWHRDGPRATMSGGSYPGAMFPCADGWVSIACRAPREYRALLTALGNPEWSRYPGYDDPRIVARFHADEVDPYVIEWTKARTKDEIFAEGQRYGFPVAPVLTVAEAVELEQFAHRRFFLVNADGTRVPGGPYRLVEPPSPPQQSAKPTKGLGRRADRPLTGLRILDLSWVWSGPMVTAGLCDLGAEVIKIEHRGRADPARLRGPALRDGKPVEGPELEVTPYFNQMNRGKRSVAIDMGTEDGASLIRHLAAVCDVVVENMRPGVLARHGLDYANLAAINPSLVMVSMSMFGQTGPLSGLRGYAPVMSGLAGLDSLVGYDEDSLIGTYNPALGDPNGAAHALFAVLAALVGRERTGRGCYIDLSQVEALISVLRVPVLWQQQKGSVPIPANTHAQWWPHGTFRCAGDDAWVSVSARTERERAALAALVGAAPGAKREELTTALALWTAERDPSSAAQQLMELGVPAAEVRDFFGAMESDWARARHVRSVVVHPWLGEQEIVTLPWKVDGNAFEASGPAPLLGADTGEVLSDLLGLSDDELSDLRRRRIIE